MVAKGVIAMASVAQKRKFVGDFEESIFAPLSSPAAAEDGDAIAARKRAKLDHQSADILPGKSNCIFVTCDLLRMM